MKFVDNKTFASLMKSTLSSLQQLIPFMSVDEREMMMNEIFGFLEENPARGLVLNKLDELYSVEEISHLDSQDFERDCLSY